MSKATDDLESQGIPYRLFRHIHAVNSLEQAAEQRGQQPGQVVRTIVFCLETGEYVLALMAGPNQLSWPALRRTLGQRRIRMANPAEVQSATGYVPGTVSPFGLPAPLRIFVDRSVLDFTEISLGSGERGLAILMASTDLQQALIGAMGKPEWVVIGDWGLRDVDNLIDNV
jgi:Cys-tRNA(Pro)/Cys-tRNA(Cys) deacylase